MTGKAPVSAGLACGTIVGGAVFGSWWAVATTRGRTALLSCALISTAAKRTATTKRARRALCFIIFLGDVQAKTYAPGRKRWLRFAHAAISCQLLFIGGLRGLRRFRILSAF